MYSRRRSVQMSTAGPGGLHLQLLAGAGFAVVACPAALTLALHTGSGAGHTRSSSTRFRRTHDLIRGAISFLFVHVARRIDLELGLEACRTPARYKRRRRRASLSAARICARSPFEKTQCGLVADRLLQVRCLVFHTSGRAIRRLRGLCLGRALPGNATVIEPNSVHNRAFLYAWCLKRLTRCDVILLLLTKIPLDHLAAAGSWGVA
jgi:hypothetical protein